MKRTSRAKPRHLNSYESELSSESEFEGKTRRYKIKKRKSGTRNESSLSVLTTKFLELLKKAPDGSVDLNEAVKIL